VCRYVEKEDEFDIVPLDTLKSRTSDDVFVDICAVDDDAQTNDLITLPATVLPDADTLAAYQTRKQIAAQMEEKRRREEAQKMSEDTRAAASSATSMQDVPPPASPSSVLAVKRPLEEQPSSTTEDDSNKRIKL
jgi:hypothetical protein